MSILTSRELEFITSLRTDWSRLYRSELARLLKEGGNPCDARIGVISIVTRDFSGEQALAMDRSANENRSLG